MFTADEFRAKAIEYTQQMKHTTDPGKLRDLQRLEQSFTWLARNEEWLSNRLEKCLSSDGVRLPEGASQEVDGRRAAENEEHILRCLGAAVIMQWNTFPTKLQRELFDTAGSMGELLKTAELRAQIARFLHDRKDHDGGRNAVRGSTIGLRGAFRDGPRYPLIQNSTGRIAFDRWS